MRIFQIVLFILVLLVPTSAFAQIGTCVGKSDTGKDTIVIFVNGIQNTEEQACLSSELLRSRLIENGMSENSFDYDYRYNQNGTLTQDLSELRIQAEISNIAHGQSGDYDYNLGQIYARHIAHGYRDQTEVAIYGTAADLYNNLKASVLNGKNIIVVAHSQGNYLSEAAHALFVYYGEKDIVRHIRFVGVAVVASSTPNGVYVSARGDTALSAHRTQTLDLKNFGVLPSNVDVCASLDYAQYGCGAAITPRTFDWNKHSFTQIYLASNIVVRNTEQSLPKMISVLVQTAEGDLNRIGAYIRKDPKQPEVYRPTTPQSANFTVVMAGRWMSGLFGILLRVDKSASKPVEYQWDFGDGKVSNSKAPSMSHNYHADGIYRIRLMTRLETGEVAVCNKTFIMNDDFNSKRYDKVQIPCE